MRNKKQQVALEKLGEIVSKHRKQAGISRIKLAVELNSDEKQIRRIEKGEVNPTILTLFKIFFILKIDIEILSKIKIDKTFLED